MRVLKTKWFTKAAKSHSIKDSELCQAIEAVAQGKADDLGGGVYKKRLNQNRDRAIILAKGGVNWFTRSCMPSRIWRTLMIVNWLGSANWRSTMPTLPMKRLRH